MILQDLIDAMKRVMYSSPIWKPTVLIATSSSKVVQICNKIAVLHEGKVAELGSHFEVLEKKGLYSEFIKRR